MERFRVHVDSPGWERRSAREVYATQMTAQVAQDPGLGAGFGPGFGPSITSHRWWLLVENDRGKLTQIASDACSPCHATTCNVEECGRAGEDVDA